MKNDEKQVLLDVKNLKKYFNVGNKKILKAVDDFPFRFIKERLLVWLESLDVVNLPSEELLSICMILQMVR